MSAAESVKRWSAKPKRLPLTGPDRHKLARDIFLTPEGRLCVGQQPTADALRVLLAAQEQEAVEFAASTHGAAHGYILSSEYDTESRKMRLRHATEYITARPGFEFGGESGETFDAVLADIYMSAGHRADAAKRASYTIAPDLILLELAGLKADPLTVSGSDGEAANLWRIAHPLPLSTFHDLAPVEEKKPEPPALEDLDEADDIRHAVAASRAELQLVELRRAKARGLTLDDFDDEKDPESVAGLEHICAE